MLAAALFLRPARRAPLRLAATILGVAAGIAALVSTRISSRAALGTLTDDVTALAGQAQLEVVADGGVDVEWLARLAPLASEVEALPVVDRIVVAPALGDTLRVLGVDVLASGDAARVELGVDTAEAPGTDAHDAAWSVARAVAIERTLRCEGAWISRGLASELGLAPGGTLELDVRGRLRPIAIAGLFAPRNATRAFDRVVVFDVACAQELFATPDSLDRIELAPRGGAPAPDLRGRARALLPAHARVQSPTSRADEAREISRTLAFHLDSMALISLLVGGILVAISLATSVVPRREVLAVLVSLGAGRVQIARTLALEALSIGLVGGLVGAVAGWGAAHLAAGGVRQTLSATAGAAPSAALELRASDLALGLALGALASLVAALLPILEARRTPPIQNLRRERPDALSRRAWIVSAAGAASALALAPIVVGLPPWNGLPIPAVGGMLLLQVAVFFVLAPVFELVGEAGASVRLPVRAGTIVRLSLSALSSGRRRAVWAAGAVAVAVGLSVSIATVIGSFRETILEWSHEAFSADFWIRPQPTELGAIVGELDPAIVALAEQQFGAPAVERFHRGRAQYAGVGVALAGAEFEVVKRRGIMRFVDRRDPRAVFEQAWQRGECTVNQAFSLRFHKQAGDEIEFVVGSTTFRKRIAGVCIDYGDSQGEIVIDGPDLRRALPENLPHQVALFLEDDVDREAARRTFLAALPADARVEMISVGELRQRMLDIFERTFAVTRGMELVSASVAVIAVLTVLFALLTERRGEIGILRALGASASQVGATIGVQAGLLGGIGALLGCAAGLGVGWMLVNVMQVQSFRWTLDLHAPWWPMVEICGGVTAMCALAGLWPAFVATRWSPRELLREDE